MSSELMHPLKDDQLRQDLQAIAAEVRRRKQAKPRLSFTMWALRERQAALQRYEQRLAQDMAI